MIIVPPELRKTEEVKMRPGNVLITALLVLVWATCPMSGSTDVKINYTNDSLHTDKPTIFVFAKNLIPTFDVLTDGVAWKTMPLIEKGSRHSFVFPGESTLQAVADGIGKTGHVKAESGKRYRLDQTNAGLAFSPAGSADNPQLIEVVCGEGIPGEVMVSLCKSGRPILKHRLARDKPAHFRPSRKLYWGIASRMDTGLSIGGTVLHTDEFFEQDIEGVDQACVTLIGNPREGYQFITDDCNDNDGDAGDEPDGGM